MLGMRPVNELQFVEDNRLSMPAVAPEVPIERLADILKTCQLPPPFPRNTRLDIHHAELPDPESPSLPALVWKVVEMVPASFTPKEKLVYRAQFDPQTIIYVYQMNFENLVQFDVYAKSHEEAATLRFWAINQINLFRHVVADAGAQHIRFRGSSDDFLLSRPAVKAAGRAFRYAYSTVTTYPSVRPLLRQVNVTTGTSICRVALDVLQRGEDRPTHPHVTLLLSVTSPDGALTYDPRYDVEQRRIVWDPGQPQPNDGDSYIVRYLYYGDDPTRMVVMDAPLDEPQ